MSCFCFSYGSCFSWRVPERPRWILVFFRVGVGWGDDKVFCTCTHVECYATCLGWVRWGDDNVPCTCTHVECYATCLGWVGWGDDNVPYTCTHVECYATCPGWVGWGDDNVPCTRTHVECYATCLGWVGWGDDNVPCTCTHVWHETGQWYVPTKCGQCMAWDWTTVQRMTTKQKKVSRSECFPQNWHGTVAKRRFRFKALRFTAFWIPPFLTPSPQNTVRVTNSIKRKISKCWKTAGSLRDPWPCFKPRYHSCQ